MEQGRPGQVEPFGAAAADRVGPHRASKAVHVAATVAAAAELLAAAVVQLAHSPLLPFASLHLAFSRRQDPPL